MNLMFPITHPQKRIWYVEKTYPGTSVSNIAATVRIKEKIDFAALEKAINHVVKINDGLRTRIIEHNGQPVQYFSTYSPFKIDLVDFSGCPTNDLYKWDTKLSGVPLSFLDSDLYYFAMFKLNESEGGFYSKLHHIITDAWTEVLLYSQIMNAYRAFGDGREPDDKALSYVEYIAREQKYLASEKFNSDQLFWAHQFSPVPDLVTLQTKKMMEKSIAARRKAYVISHQEAEQIREFCQVNGITVFAFFLSMLTVYINRITGANDIVLGTPVLNRTNAREKQIFGMFISTVPLLFRLDESLSAIDYARQINSDWISILRHQQYPYDLLLRDIRKNNSNIENLFEITLSYQNAKVQKNTMPWDGATRWHFSGFQHEPMVIHINDRDDEGSLIINYDYKISCFSDKEIDFIHSHLRSLMADTITRSDKPISALSLIGQEELQRILKFNDTADDYDRNTTVAELFEQQVDRTPEAEAAIFHDEAVTFKELDEAANRLAHYLRGHGLKPDDAVAIILPRGIEVVSSMLGVMKAGGAFLPIDPAYPEERKKYMLDNSGARFVVTTSDLADTLAIDPQMVITPGDKTLGKMPAWRLPLINKPEDLVYINYTSGSTGLPKGVMVKHSGLTALMHALPKIMYFKAGEAVLSITTIAFDIFVLEIFPSLINGMKVVIADEKAQIIPSLQKSLICKHRIVKFLSTPVRMQMLLDDPGSRECFSYLKEIMLGGDVFPEKLLKRLKEATSARIINGYGPTEITVGVTFKDLTNTSVVNIGQPIANSQIYILDRHMNMVPIGVPGEIYIGGEGLARGYLNNPDLTAEKFVANPFSPGERLYRTGDLGRWYPKGEIAFLGRIDNQVKIRGIRIELGEIENAIRQLPQISDVVVLDIEDQGKKVLCAYLQVREGSELDFHIFRNELSRRLPTYMVPAYYMTVDSIPINSSGKVDRRGLPLPDKSKLIRCDFEPPADEYEERLSQIWEEILEIQNISCSEDFFDLGGDSMAIVTLIAAIHDEFGVEMTINDFYAAPSVRKQAQKIQELMNLEPAKDNLPKNIVPLRNSGASNRLFLVHAGNGEAANYFKLSGLLPDDLGYYGLRYIADDLAPSNLIIPELAKLYLNEVLSVQPDGPYYLAGWCIGGTIAFEMARQLEEMGREAKRLLLINTICPRVWDEIDLFSPETELQFLSQFLPMPKIAADSAANAVTIWQTAVQEIAAGQVLPQNIRNSVPGDVAAAIPNFDNADAFALVKYINVIRTLHSARARYFPAGLVKANTSFIEVTAHDVITDKDANLAGWQKYCAKPINRLPVEGDHFSIFTEPHVFGLAEVMKSILGSVE